MTCSEVHKMLASDPKLTPRVAPPHPRALCHRSAQLLSCFSGQCAVPQRQGRSLFLSDYSQSFLIIQISYLQICLLAKIYCNPQINTPRARAASGCAQSREDLSPFVHCSQLKSNKVTRYFLVSALRPVTSVILVVYLVPRLLHFCAFVGDFAV